VRDLSGARTLEAQLRAALAAATEAEDRERQTLAADLHDDVGQLLTLAGLKLGGLRQTARMRAVKAGLSEVLGLVTHAHQRIDSLTFQLSPPILRDVGLASAAEWLAEEIERSYGLRVKVERDGEPSLDEATRTALFRALRELLINAARHAHTEEARMKLTREGGDLLVTVEDDGIGFDHRGGGFGLVSIRERLEALGVRFEIESTPGRGTRARIIVPLVAAADGLPD
jgi:signal transduction histidine kinase